jgi:hypothetical protein
MMAIILVFLVTLFILFHGFSEAAVKRVSVLEFAAVVKMERLNAKAYLNPVFEQRPGFGWDVIYASKEMGPSVVISFDDKYMDVNSYLVDANGIAKKVKTRN